MRDKLHPHAKRLLRKLSMDASVAASVPQLRRGIAFGERQQCRVEEERMNDIPIEDAQTTQAYTQGVWIANAMAALMDAMHARHKGHDVARIDGLPKPNLDTMYGLYCADCGVECHLVMQALEIRVSSESGSASTRIYAEGDRRNE